MSAPTSAPEVPPRQQQHGAHWDTLSPCPLQLQQSCQDTPCTEQSGGPCPFSFCLSTDVPPVRSALEPPGTCPIQLQQSHQGSPMKNDQGPPACTHYNSSQPVKASRHMQSEQEDFPIQDHSFKEEVVVSPNSYKETQKVKQNEDTKIYDPNKKTR